MKLCFTTTLIAHPDYMKDTVGEFIPFNTKEYDFISSGEFHDKWFSELKKNQFIDKETKKRLN